MKEFIMKQLVAFVFCSVLLGVSAADLLENGVFESGTEDPLPGWSYNRTEINHQLDSLYQAVTEEMKQKLLQINNTEPSGIVNVSAEFSDRTKEGSELTQYLGVATTESSSSFDTLAIPESDWAVFTACGAFPEALQNTWATIYAEWLPRSGYTLTGGPEILWNESEDTTKENYKSEIWIPIKKG